MRVTQEYLAVFFTWVVRNGGVKIISETKDGHWIASVADGDGNLMVLEIKE